MRACIMKASPITMARSNIIPYDEQCTIPARYQYPSPAFERYWKIGYGKQSAIELGVDLPDETEIRKLVPLLLQTDQLADQVVKEVLVKCGFAQTMSWIKEGILNDSISPDVPEPLRLLMEFSLQTPVWLDVKKVENGARLCRRSGLKGFGVLRNYCLMGGFESAAINKPLIFTGALKTGAAKRLMETTEFWVKIIGENVLHSREGIHECIKIRLMHAYARHSVLKSDSWESTKWGEPLNQWDMVATNLGFSYVFLVGLRRIGMRPTLEEVAGLLHFWKYTGYLLGIPIEFLPDREVEAMKAIYAWMITQPAADDDSKALAHALMLEPLESKYPKEQSHKERVVQIQLSYNNFFLGKESCQAMELPFSPIMVYPWMQYVASTLQESLIHMSSSLMDKSVIVNYRLQQRVAYEFMKGHGKTSTVTKFQSDELFLSHNSLPWIVLIIIISIVFLMSTFKTFFTT